MANRALMGGERSLGRGGGGARWRVLGLICILVALTVSRAGATAPLGGSLPAQTGHIADPGSALGAVAVGVSPSPKTVQVDASFTMDVYIAAGSNSVNAADVHLSFDPTCLRLLQEPVAGSALPTVLGSQYNNTAGTIDFGAFKPGGSATGTFVLCTLHFRALKATAGTQITRGPLGTLVVGPGPTEHTVTWSNGTVIIQAPPATNTPTATPSITPTPSFTPRPSVTPTPSSTWTPVPGQICVSAYDDLNGNGSKEAGEPLLADAQVTVRLQDGPIVGQYVTDGIHEPSCFTLEANQTYVVTVTSPPLYTGSGPQSASRYLTSGDRWNLDFGQVRLGLPATETPTPTLTVTALPTETLAWRGLFLPLAFKRAEMAASRYY